MPECAIVSCKNANKLYSLPESPALRAAWLEKINRLNYVPTANTRVCEVHFDSNAFIPDEENKDKKNRVRKKRTLKQRSVPTLFLKTAKETSSEKKTRAKRTKIPNPRYVITPTKFKVSKIADHGYFKNESENNVENDKDKVNRKRKIEIPIAQNNENEPVLKQPRLGDIEIDTTDQNKSNESEKTEQDVAELDFESAASFVNHVANVVSTETIEDTEKTKSTTPTKQNQDDISFEYVDICNEVEVEFDELAHLRATINKQNKELEDQKKEMEAMKEKNNKLSLQVDKVSQFLTPDQMRRLTLPEGSHPPWSDDSIEMFIRWLARLHGSYDYVRGHIFPKNLVATRRCLQKKLTKVSCGAGEVVTDFVRFLGYKAESMSEQTRCCNLNVDEMTLSPAYVYDARTQSFIGTITVPLGRKLIQKRIKENGKYEPEKELAYHAMSIVLVGLCALDNGDPWKQWLGCQLTGYSFCPAFVARWILQAIDIIHANGLYVKGVTMDNSPANLAV